MKIKQIFILLLILSSAIVIAPASADLIPSVVLDESEIIGDAYIRSDFARYPLANLMMGKPAAAVIRSYIDFDTTSIPNDAVVYKVELTFKVNAWTAGDFLKVNEMSATGTSLSDINCYNAIGAGDNYYTAPGAYSAGTWYTINLGADAAADFTSHLAADWFSVGLQSTDEGSGTLDIFSEEDAGSEPYISVYYYQSIYYYFSAKYENGTATTILVTASSSDGTDSFNVTTDTIEAFTIRPTVFSWTPSAGLTRFIYPIGDTENFTVTLPNSTPEVYSFTLRDYVGIVGDGDCYLESWRVIGGTDTLIERNLIWNSETTTPLVLENNKVYSIKIRRNTGVLVKDFGQFVPVGADPPTLSITSFSFDQYYQPATNWISVNATRNAPAFTTITIGYADSLLMTTLATLSITNRTSGAVVYTANSTDDAHLFSWGAAGATTTYVAQLNMTHTYYGWVSKTWILDGKFTPGTVPDFSVGGISNDFLSTFIVFGVFAGIATVVNKTTALMSAAAVAAMLKVVGMFPGVGWEGIFLGGIFAVAIGLSGGADR